MNSLTAGNANLDEVPITGVTQLGPERWHRLKELFAAALDLPRAQRAAFVAGSCSDDPELHVRILELVRAAEVEDGFIVQSAAKQLD
jgi:hypothetical protein